MERKEGEIQSVLQVGVHLEPAPRDWVPYHDGFNNVVAEEDIDPDDFLFWLQRYTRSRSSQRSRCSARRMSMGG